MRRAAPGEGKRQADGWRLPSSSEQLGAGRGGARILLQRGDERRRGAGAQLGVLVEQQAEAAAGALQQVRVVRALAAAQRQADELVDRGVCARGAGGPVARRVVEHEHLGGERERLALAGDGVEAAEQQRALIRVDDAVRDLDVHVGRHTDATVRGRRLLPGRVPGEDLEALAAARRHLRSGADRARVGEPRPLGDELRRPVVAVGADLQRGEAELRVGPVAHERHGAVRQAAAAGRRGGPVAELALRAVEGEEARPCRSAGRRRRRSRRAPAPRRRRPRWRRAPGSGGRPRRCRATGRGSSAGSRGPGRRRRSPGRPPPATPVRRPRRR